MSVGLLNITAFIYCWVAVNYFVEGRIGMGIAFTAYALANIGFAMDLRP